jgi:DNA-binding CsgD family transcriptional regulator
MGRYTAEVLKAKKEEVSRLLEEGHSRAEIKRQTGVSETTIRRWHGRDPYWEDVARGDRLVAAKEMVDARVPYARIERSLGISQTTLRKRFGNSPHDARSLELANERRSRVSRERYEEAVRLRMKEGLRNGEIARRVGLSEARIWNMLGPTPARLGGVRPHPPTLRERARYLREVGYSIREISIDMKLPQSTVGDWVRGMPCG